MTTWRFRRGWQRGFVIWLARYGGIGRAKSPWLCWLILRSSLFVARGHRDLARHHVGRARHLHRYRFAMDIAVR